MLHFLSLALLAASVSAHSIFQELWVAGKDEASKCIRMPKTNSPMTDVSSPDMRCNVGGAKGVPGICDVEAGQNITVEMHQQPNDRKCGKESAIGGRHYGPVMVYMCSVPDATTSNGDCSWVKVAEDSYAGTDESWGTEKLNKNCGKKSFIVPKNLKAGQYLVRAEALALHTAGGKNGAQFYMSCYQVKVAGSGTQSLPPGVKFPGAYKQNDPGVLVDIWGNKNLKYIAPGPKVWSAGGSAPAMEKPTIDDPAAEKPKVEASIAKASKSPGSPSTSITETSSTETGKRPKATATVNPKKAKAKASGKKPKGVSTLTGLVST